MFSCHTAKIETIVGFKIKKEIIDQTKVAKKRDSFDCSTMTASSLLCLFPDSSFAPL